MHYTLDLAYICITHPGFKIPVSNQLWQNKSLFEVYCVCSFALMIISSATVLYIMGSSDTVRCTCVSF
uniref:Uncharacterized protein n=1 Tax=Arundo donax TaxID=35708 RepID=A0A0A9AVT4_ARUDO